jgi:hypothetical protein
MIRYALQCASDHGFEAWFSNSDAYDKQAKKHQIACPECGDTGIRKQIMAPAVATSRPSPDQEIARFASEVRKKIAETHEYVGDRFADEARSMFYGDSTERSVWGEVTPDVARELAEEGIPAAPLPPAFTPDPPVKRERMN